MTTAQRFDDFSRPAAAENGMTQLDEFRRHGQPETLGDAGDDDHSRSILGHNLS